MNVGFIVCLNLHIASWSINICFWVARERILWANSSLIVVMKCVFVRKKIITQKYFNSNYFYLRRIEKQFQQKMRFSNQFPCRQGKHITLDWCLWMENRSMHSLIGRRSQSCSPRTDIPNLQISFGDFNLRFQHVGLRPSALSLNEYVIENITRCFGSGMFWGKRHFIWIDKQRGTEHQIRLSPSVR